MQPSNLPDPSRQVNSRPPQTRDERNDFGRIWDTLGSFRACAPAACAARPTPRRRELKRWRGPRGLFFCFTYGVLFELSVSRRSLRHRAAFPYMKPPDAAMKGSGDGVLLR